MSGGKGYFSFVGRQVLGRFCCTVQQSKRELASFLAAKEFKAPNVVVMPDFFMDRLIDLDFETSHFCSEINDIVERKGGSIDQIAQTDLRGGNAVNVASALLALGAKVTPIVCTSKLGLEQIRFHLKEFNVDVSHIKTSSKSFCYYGVGVQDIKRKSERNAAGLGFAC